MRWLLIIAAVVSGLSNHDVIITNETGLTIARIEIGKTWLEGTAGANINDKILVRISPIIQHLRVVFRGGASVDWPRFNFSGVHEIILERTKNKFDARVE